MDCRQRIAELNDIHVEEEVTSKAERNDMIPTALAVGLGAQLAVLIVAIPTLLPTVVMRAAGTTDAYLFWAVFASVSVCGAITAVVRRPRLTPQNQRKSRPYHADRRPTWAPNNRERGASLLDAMFRGTGADDAANEPAWPEPALYALACALTALWSSVGVLPSIVAGEGVGTIAAGQAAGVFNLEDRLRLAAAGDDADAALDDIAFAPPAVGMVSSATGRMVEPDDALDGQFWHRQTREREPLERCAGALTEAGVDAVIEIGPQAVLGPALARAWPEPVDGGGKAAILPSLGQSSEDERARMTGADAGFAEAVALAYEAGLPISFAGLFAGETRRRISLPSYPFQHRRFWISQLEKQAQSAPA